MRLLTLSLLFAPASAAAVSLTLQSTSTPAPGVTLYDYRTSSPSADVWVAEVDLCADGVSIESSKASSSRTMTGAWASGRGLQLGVNGDFYRTSPLRVYGEAIGEGIAWPLDQTGVDSQYSYEWFYKDYGYIALGHDRVDFTHTKWVKSQLGPSTGWAAGTVAPDAPAGTLALVSGFPQLVVDGAVHTCADPTDG